MNIMDNRVAPVLRMGDEPFTGDGPVACLKNFWSWYASDLLEGSIRGPFAEYLVATALGIEGQARMGWQSTDLTARNGTTIEVKCASRYTVLRGNERVRSLSFDIRQRTAQAYVLCVLESREPLDVDAWKFYVVPKALLNNKRPVGEKGGNSISMGKLEQELQVHPCRWRDLRAAVETIGPV